MTDSEPQAMPAVLFEGEAVTDMVGKIPLVTMPMDAGFERHTHLRLSMEVRVKHIRYEEGKDGNLVRHHIFEVMGASYVATIPPGENRQDEIGGSASAYSTPDAETTQELGVEFRRTSDTWPG